MNKIKIDFPERYQANAFMMWFERTGFELFQKFYAEKMPDERQPHEIECDDDSLYIIIE